MHKKSIPLLLLLFLFCSCSSPNKKSGEDRLKQPQEIQFAATLWPDRIMQSVSENPSNQINLSWRSSSNVSEGFVEFAVLSEKIQEDLEAETKKATVLPVTFKSTTDHYFQAKITGLQPNTSYMVRVGSIDHRSEWFTVRTAPEYFEPFHFLYFGDMQNEILEYGSRTFRKAFSMFPDSRFMIHAGDLVLSSGNDDTWGEWFYAGGWSLQQIPSLPVAGNSDHFRLEKNPVDKRMLFPQWHGVFDLPKNGPAGLENLSYYFDYPGLRVIALYSNFESLDEENKEIYVKENFQLTDQLFYKQLEWLENILESNTQPWVITVIHHPVFTARKDRENELLQKYFLPLLGKYKVDLVLQGHDHVYARGINPQSETRSQLPVYVISISGGKMREVDHNHLWIKKSVENTQIFSVINIGHNFLTFEAYDITGTLRDSFRINK